MVVSLGDSYISGEAGRWMGNSNGFTGSEEGSLVLSGAQGGEEFLTRGFPERDCRPRGVRG